MTKLAKKHRKSSKSSVEKSNTSAKQKMETNLPKLASDNLVEPPIKKVKTIPDNDSGDNRLQSPKVQTNKKNKIVSRTEMKPSFGLRDMGQNASLTVSFDERTPLFLSDIQHLLLYSQLIHMAPYSPARWCCLEKGAKLTSTTIFIVENVSLYDYESNESRLPFLRTSFNIKLEILSPKSYNGDLIKELTMVPLSSSQMRRFTTKHGTLEKAVVKSTEIFDLVRTIFPINSDNKSVPPIKNNNKNKELPKHDNFPRTQLLLSAQQMIEENYPLPIVGLAERKYDGYVLTKDEYDPVTASSPMFGVDCEMCLTSINDNELTRISVVDEQLNVFYDTLVKPYNRIINYLTQFSGITPQMMWNVTKRIQDVHNDLRRLLPKDAILVGQSLSNDLHAMKMMHPYVIDTSVIFNMTGDRSRKTKLKILTEEFLSERIQESSSGHCSTEDSSASLKLAQLKLKHDITFGDAVMGNIRTHFKKPPELGTYNYATSIFRQIIQHKKKPLITGTKDITDKYQYYFNKNAEIQHDGKSIRFISENKNRDMIKRFGKGLKHAQFNVCHMVNDNSENNESMLDKIDKWASEIYDNVNNSGLVVVLLAGKQNANGVCFIKIKSDS